ncbi:two pore domain potassium channel family protein [Candidatus Woesearchaeota archaeon]|nr:two pore domain potassium channel family protein [Candidatus Woesearchaeota archaeon]
MQKPSASFHEKILFSILMVTILLGFGTIFYSQTEAWSYIDALYFSTMTLTTVGYGDLVPTTPVSKLVTSVYAILGIGIMLYLLISVVGEYIFKQEKYFDSLVYKLHNLGASLGHSNKKRKR